MADHNDSILDVVEGELNFRAMAEDEWQRSGFRLINNALERVGAENSVDETISLAGAAVVYAKKDFAKMENTIMLATPSKNFFL